MIRLAIFLALGTAPAAFADGGFFTGRDVVFLGEQHDNPAHHRKQAELVGEIAPQALVFEMLTPEQAARVTPDLIADEDALRPVTAEEKSWGWFAIFNVGDILTVCGMIAWAATSLFICEKTARK